MKSFRIPDENVSFQMAPMIDVVFLLIIFFMVAANLKQTLKVEVDLPVAQKSEVPKNPGNRAVVSIRADGTIYVGALPYSGEQVAEQLAERAEGAAAFGVFIRADRGTPHRHVAEVLRSCADVGIENVIVAAYQSDK